jgi:multidrug efflux pump subunit AcrB
MILFAEFRSARTALTAALALIPLALGGGEPGNELQTPMAILIPSGLATVQPKQRKRFL